MVRRVRPNFTQVVRALIRDVAKTMPEFAHVRPARILVVAGEARRASRGTVKPLAFDGAKSRDRQGRHKPVVRINGRRMLYCITLRPLFFRASTAETRVATILHELYHASRRFDGTLSRTRRHATLGNRFALRLRPLVRQYLKRCPAELYAQLAYDGEVRMLQWLERPGPALPPEHAHVRRVYTEEQLFTGTVRMVTRRTRPVRGPRTSGRIQ